MKPILLFIVLLAGSAFAELPQTLHHQGRIAAGGVNFDGTGQFKFLLYHGTAPGTVSTPLWKNDDSTPADAVEPASSVTTLVTKGLYTSQLGSAPQAALPASIIPPSGQDLYLRIWFDDGANGYQQLSPDQSIGAVPFAKHVDISGQNISSLNNDAGFLTAGGDITADSYQLTTPVAKKLQIPSVSFTTDGFGDLYTFSAFGRLSPAGIGNANITFYAPVSLPDGATVTAVTVFGLDSSSNYNLNIQASLLSRAETATSSVVSVASRFLNMTGSLPGIRTSPNGSVPNPLISQDFQYYAQVTLSRTGSGSVDGGLGFYGMSIEYTVDEL